MNVGRLCSSFVLAAVIVHVACASSRASLTITGTLLSPAGQAGFLRVATGDKTVIVKPASGAKIMRGQVGAALRPAALSDFAAGDRIVAVIGQNDHAASIKAFFDVVRDNLVEIRDRTLVFESGKSASLNPEARIVLADGRAGSVLDLKPGAFIICRLNPASGECWMALVTAATSTAGPSPRKVPPKEPAPTGSKVRITAITYSSPMPLKPGDLITVDLTGTPGAAAVFEVKHLIPPTPMKELSPGAYHAVTKVPTGKVVRDAPLLGRLSLGGSSAGPVQASRLITLTASASAPPAKQPNPTATHQPDQPESLVPPGTISGGMKPNAPVALPHPRKTTEDALEIVDVPKGKVIITLPNEGAKLDRTLVVKGRADPASKIRITITYTNGKSRIMRLGGELISRDVVTDKNGDFKVGPIAVDGLPAGDRLTFTIKAYYPDHGDHGAAVVHTISAGGQ